MQIINTHCDLITIAKKKKKTKLTKKNSKRISAEKVQHVI